MWPDWAIFESTIIGDYLDCIEKCHFLVKTSLATCRATFGYIWATFLPQCLVTLLVTLTCFFPPCHDLLSRWWRFHTKKQKSNCLICWLNVKIIFHGGGSPGLVVAFYCDDLSLNPTKKSMVVTSYMSCMKWQ